MTGPVEPGPGRRLVLHVLVPAFVAVTIVAVVVAVAGPRRSSSDPVLPLDLVSVSDAVAGHYHAAAEFADVYRDVPCYCGCEEFLAHRDLYDCFVRADGQGWEAHAAGCGVCIAESALVRDLAGSGTPPAAITAAVIDRFGTTPTTAPTL